MTRTLTLGLSLALLCLGPTAAYSGAHSWRFNEVFSNADGTVQFIELQESAGNSFEVNLDGKWITETVNGTTFNFPGNLTGDTANRHLLLATAAFAALAGAPTPDYIIPENFLPLDSDNLEYWFYSAANWGYGVGQLPTDGTNSLNPDYTTGINSPTNYAGESGSVDAGATLAANPLPVTPGLRLSRALPNPARSRVQWTLDLPEPGTVRSDVLGIQEGWYAVGRWIAEPPVRSPWSGTAGAAMAPPPRRGSTSCAPGDRPAPRMPVAYC